MESESVEQILATIQALGNAKTGARDSFAMVPNGYRLEPVERLVERFRDLPARIREVVTLHTPLSFVEYVKGFGNFEDAIVFADAGNKTFRAVLDYHGEMPGWCEHIALFTPNATPEWLTWTSSSGHAMSQMGFVEFIENNSPDIESPPAADMKQMVRELKTQRKVDFQSAVNVSNGNVAFTYSTADQTAVGKGKVEIPEEFTLRLVAYECGDPIQIEARLRYRIKEGALTMWYELFRPHIVEQDEFNKALEVITKGVDPIKVYRGA